MRLSEITIGMECLTEVSGTRVKVKVISRVEPGDSGAYYKKRVSFRLQRVDNGRVLEKTRDSAALHPLPKPDTFSVVLYENEASLITKGSLVFEATENFEDARVSFREVKEEIRVGTKKGIVRLLKNGGPFWRYPKAPEAHKVASENYEWALRTSTGWCPACRAFEVEGVEPDARNQKCDKCGGLEGCGAEWALTSGLIQIVEPVKPPEPPKRPSWESKTKSTDPRRALALGVVQHHFHGDYSATLVLGFRQGVQDDEEAANRLADEALQVLRTRHSGFEWARGTKACVYCTLPSDHLKILVDILKSDYLLRAEPCGFTHCRDGGEHHKNEITGCPHSIDVGPFFTVEVPLPSLAEDPNQSKFNF